MYLKLKAIKGPIKARNKTHFGNIDHKIENLKLMEALFLRKNMPEERGPS